jgi:Fe-S-cluster containining protein
MCCAESVVFLDPSEVQSRKYRTMSWQGKAVLLKEKGKCVYLTHDAKQARCSIHEDRPRLCREMDQYLCYLWAPMEDGHG